MKYVYPAVFYKEDDGRYSICFPDFNAATCGNDLNDAMNMAVECLAVQLIGLKRDGEAFPVSSPVDTVDPVAYAEELGAGKPSDYFVNLISVDADEYAKLHFNKSVRKNLTIPKWMNEKALAQGINFSQVLQEALLERLQA